MSLFSRLSSKNIDEFAKELAVDLAKRYPPAMERDEKKSLSAKRITTILENTCAKASEFKKTNKLGFYKKARLGNSFKWELKEQGYSDTFVDVATESLVVYITRNE